MEGGQATSAGGKKSASGRRVGQEAKKGAKRGKRKRQWLKGCKLKKLFVNNRAGKKKDLKKIG